MIRYDLLGGYVILSKRGEVADVDGLGGKKALLGGNKPGQTVWTNESMPSKLRNSLPITAGRIGQLQIERRTIGRAIHMQNTEGLE